MPHYGVAPAAVLSYWGKLICWPAWSRQVADSLLTRESAGFDNRPKTQASRSGRDLLTLLAINPAPIRLRSLACHDQPGGCNLAGPWLAGAEELQPPAPQRSGPLTRAIVVC